MGIPEFVNNKVKPIPVVKIDRTQNLFESSNITNIMNDSALSDIERMVALGDEAKSLRNIASMLINLNQSVKDYQYDNSLAALPLWPEEVNDAESLDELFKKSDESLEKSTEQLDDSGLFGVSQTHDNS